MAKKEFNLEVEAKRYLNKNSVKYTTIVEELLKDPNRDYSNYYRKNLSQMEVMSYLLNKKLYSNGYIANIETKDIEKELANGRKASASDRTIRRCILNLVEYGYLNKYDECSYRKDREDNYQSRKVVYHLVATEKFYNRLAELNYINDRPSDADLKVLDDFYSNLVKTSISTVTTKTVERDFIKTTTYQNGKKTVNEKEIY